MNAAQHILNDDLIAADVEAIVIGTVILDSNAIGRAVRLLKDEHFAIPAHRLLFQTCADLWRSGTGVDLITVTMALRKAGRMEEVGGAFGIVGFTRLVAASTHLEYHCAIVRDQYGLRHLRQTGMRLASDAKMGEDPDALISALSLDIRKASIADIQTDVNAGDRAYAMLNEASRPKPMYLGMANLDGMVFVNDGNVVTISAPAGVGKTAFILSAILNLMPQRRPWIVSLEMPADELISRALCQLALIDIDRVMEGKITSDEKDRLALAATQHSGILSLMDIDDTGSMSIDQFCARAEHKVKNEGCNLIALDYAQLLDADRKIHRNQSDQFEAISKGIRATGRKLNVPILCVVHVNREGLAHGSTQFEKDAHVRLNLSRDPFTDMMTVDVQKNRNGRTGKIETPCAMRYGIVGRPGSPGWGIVRNEDLPF